MPEETNALIKKIKQAAASGTTEHIVNILKAGLTTTPFCGGIASLMSDYIPSSLKSKQTNLHFCSKIAFEESPKITRMRNLRHSEEY